MIHSLHKSPRFFGDGFAQTVITCKITARRLATLLCCSCSMVLMAQNAFTLQSETLPNPENTPAPVFPVPNERQMAWNETEFYAFFHYGMNTYTNKEWGNGDENESLFAPTKAPNPRQWLEAVKAAGMRGGIAVVKHHDGFCLWPTSTTTHNVTLSGNAFGKATNIPRDFAKAAKALNMKYGFYISPWDRNSKYYGTDDYLPKVFFRQCAEIAQYGADQFEMWFDGANGGTGYYGGRRGTVTIDPVSYYDMPNLRDSILKICPNIVFWGLGGEARWIGNESGFAGETCWSPMNTKSPERNGNQGEENGAVWFPGESDAKLTNKGWFWHPGEVPMSPERVFQMYLETVGRNSTLILNCPPDRSGELPPATVNTLKKVGELLKQRLTNDLAKKATITVSSARKNGVHRHYDGRQLNDGDKNTYWATNDGENQATITLTWDTPQTIHYVSLAEYIRLGQRVKRFHIETSADGQTWIPRANNITTTTIGYKRIIPLNGSTANSYDNGFQVKAVRITIDAAKSCPLLHTVSVY